MLIDERQHKRSLCAVTDIFISVLIKTVKFKKNFFALKLHKFERKAEGVPKTNGHNCIPCTPIIPEFRQMSLPMYDLRRTRYDLDYSALIPVRITNHHAPGIESLEDPANEKTTLEPLS